MTLRDKIKVELEKVYGHYESELETMYSEKITYEIMINQYETKTEWATYNQVIVELKKNLKLRLKLQELLYRLTDEENPKDACISVLDNISERNDELNRLYYKIKSFKNVA